MADEKTTEVTHSETPATPAVPVKDEAVAFVKDQIAEAAKVEQAPVEVVVEKPEVKTESEAKTEVPAVPDAPALPVDLIARATATGFTPEDVAEFGGEKALRRAVEVMEKKAAPATPAEPAAKPSDPTEFAFPDPSKEDPKDWDATTFQMLKAGHAMAKEFADLKKQLADLQPVIAQTASVRAEAQAAELTTQIDTAFAGLGDDFAGIVGKGTVNEIKQGSPELKARNDILAKAEILAKEAVEKGFKIPVDTLILKAAHSLFSGEVAKRRVMKADETVRDRRGQFISKPGQTGKPQEPKGSNAAEDFVRQAIAAAQT